MYLSEDEAQERITHPANLSNVVVEIKKRTGRPPGTVTLSPAAREIVAQASRVLPPVKVAEAFGITRRHASNLSRGISSNGSHGRQEINEDLKGKLDNSAKALKDQIQDKALEVLMASIDGLAEGAKGLTPVNRAKVAKEMAIIHDRLGEKKPTDQSVKVLIYAPQQKELEEYDVMDAPIKEVS